MALLLWFDAEFGTCGSPALRVWQSTRVVCVPRLTRDAPGRNHIELGHTRMQTTATPTFHKTAETFTAGAKTLARRYFISPEIFAAKHEKIFSTQGVLVGHQSQIAKAGDYFVQEVAGESLIIVGDQKGDDTRVLQRLSSPGDAIVRKQRRAIARDSMPVSRLDLWPRRWIDRRAAHGRRGRL